MSNSDTAELQDAKQHTTYDTTKNVDFLVNPESFSSPVMGDFYLGAVDGVYLKKIDEIANTKLDGGSDKDAAFYTETPPVKESDYKDGVYSLKAKVSISDEDIDNGFADGRTLNVNIDDVSGDDKAVAALKAQLLDSMKEYGSINSNASGNTCFSLRLVGLGCPATPKWAFEYDYKKSMLNLQKKKISDVTNNTQYVFSSGIHDESEELNFIKIAGKWRESTFFTDPTAEKVSFRWLMDTGDTANEQAVKAAKNLQAILNKNGNEIFFLMEDNAISRDSSMSCAAMGNAVSDESIMSELSYSVHNAPGGCAYKTGYARTHQEAFRRFSGVAYIKADGKFCNLAKVALTDSSNEELYPDEKYDGQNKDLLTPNKYDQKKQAYADAYFDVISSLDDRKKLQREIFNQDFTDLKNWTVTIGDVTLFVPPTSILCQSTVQNESQPMIRAKGSATKGGHRVTRKLQMEIYFNEDRGINGYKKDIKLPNGANLSYSLNGLRQLVAQFKFTPILPIENDYINDTLGIDAIMFDEIEIGHVDGYPKLYKVIVTASEFDYAAYMPELYTFAMQHNFEGNIFASSINWSVMRYYYQRCIRKGDMIAQTGYKFNTENYNRMLAGNRTTLIPMAFQSNEIKFYLANKEYMDEMLAARMEMLNGKAKPVIDLGKDELEAMKKLGTLSKAAREAAGSEEFLTALKSANQNSDGNIELAFHDTGDIFRSVGGATANSRYPKYGGQINKSGIIALKDGKIDHDKNFDQQINSVIGVLRNYTDAVNDTLGSQGSLISDAKTSFYSEEADGGVDVYVGITVEIGTDYLSNNDSFQDLKTDASNYVGASKDEFFKDYKLVIPLKAHFEKTKVNGVNILQNTTGFALDKDSPDMKFLSFCEQADELKKNAEEVKKRRSNVNLDQLDSLVYDEYEVGPIYIKDFKANLRNHVSQVHINNISGTSAQYLGGADTMFSVVIQTTSRSATQKIGSLPKIAAQYARDYHMLLPYYPLRVNSELTNFLGVNEVVIESATVNTGNDSTGVYTISLMLRSVDRTMREREALKKTELHNSGYNRGQARSQKKISTYFEIQDILNQAELYPDLELPTLKEINKVGYEYVRYKFQDSRKYVDPDFYFIYPQVLMSQTIRELAVNGMKAGLGESMLTDKTGASINVTPANKTGFEVSSSNDTFTQQQDSIKKTNDIAESQKKKKLEENLKSKDNSLLLNGDQEQWSICDDITPMFLEKKYRKEYEAFDAYTKSGGSSNTDSSASDSNGSSDTQRREGEWVANKLQNASDAASQIMQFLTTKAIAGNKSSEQAKKDLEKAAQQKAIASPNMAGPMNSPTGSNGDQSSKDEAVKEASQIEAVIRAAVDELLSDGDVQEIFGKINIKYSDQKFIEVFKDITYAAACAATGEKEYAGKKAQNSWRPDPTYKAIINHRDGQEISGTDLAKTLDDGVEKGIRFGCFNIRMYTRTELLRLTHDDVEAKDKGSVNDELYLLDPYYRSDPARIVEYKAGCISSQQYCAMAFLRLMLFWLAKLIEEKAVPTITNDVLRGTVANEAKIQMKQAQHGVADVSDSVMALNKNISFFNKRTYAIDSGKIFASTIMALTDGSGTILGHIKTNNYKALNAYIQSCSNPKTLVRAQESSVMPIRKLILALVGTGRIADMNAIGSSSITPATECYQRLAERKYIAAAEDPSQYIPHSFHDMIVNDARGRMLRAFPTFYMVLIDEGREIGQWKLHDNFYTTSALLNLQIVKSRKIAADTAIISMSNFYQSYSTETDDFRRQQVSESSDSGGWSDVIDSIFSPNDYAQKVEAKRSAAPPQVQLRIREGARMHIRLGYGSSASMLPVVFNGSIAEVSAEDTVEIVAQGDGIELMNPITDLEEAHEANNELGIGNWDLFNNSATTKEIMTWILTRKGGWMQEVASGTRLEGLINCNPYGLYHFGSSDLKSIHKSGEITQNIFDSWNTPIWGDRTQVDDRTPEINIQMFQKTVWDVANICKSVMPDFICGVAPFGFRSTLFIGDPRYYYAYDYDQASGALIEKRKPYEQYHIYSAYSDIIANGVRASSRKMKTVAIGMYEIDFGTGSSQQKTDPIMADIDIYPEYQKTMVVDTRLFAKSTPIVSGVLSPITNGVGWIDSLSDEEGNIVSSEKIARRMALSALVDSMRDMYCGDLVVLGDATVKPWDRIYINDTYEGFKGQAGVKEVVHNFNVDDGFTTTISPDCIVKSDAKFETIVNGAINAIGTAAVTIGAVAAYNALAKIYSHVPSIGSLFSGFMDSDLRRKATEKVGELAINAKNAASSAAGKIANEKTAEKAAKKVKTIKKGLSAAKKTVTGIKAGLAASGVGIPLLIAETAVSYVVTNAVSALIEEKLKNINAVKVFPLERYCIPYTAGIAGSKGLVISEHAQRGAGGIKAALADLFLDNPVVDIVAQCLLSDEASAAIEKVKRDNAMVDSSGEPTMSNAIFGQKYLAAVGNTMSEADYRSMMITPRVNMGKAWEYAGTNPSSLNESQLAERDKLASDISAAYENYAMLDTTRWFTDPKLLNLTVVSDDTRLKPYIEEQFLFILHEAPTLNKNKRIETQVITTKSGEEDYVKTIVEDKDGGKIYDVAMLSSDALNVLYEIVRRAKNRMPAAKATDQVEAFEQTKGSYVVLKSALRVGDKSSYSPTGYSFIVQGINDAYQPLIEAAKELESEIKEDYQSSGGVTNEALFSYTYGADKGIGNNEVLFTVFMPKMSTENVDEDTSGE